MLVFFVILLLMNIFQLNNIGEISMDYDREMVGFPKLKERLQQAAVDYLKNLQFSELTAIKEGDTLKVGGYIEPYVVSNESHLFSVSGNATTLTVLKWLVREFNEPVFEVSKADPLPYKWPVLEYVLKVYTNTPKENI